MAYNSMIFRKGFLGKLIRQRYLLMLVLPAFVLTLIFSYVPLTGWFIAFSDYQIGFSFFSGKWTGLEQFRIFFRETSDAFNIIRNTLVMNMLSLFGGLSISFVFSLLIKEIVWAKAKKAVQIITFFPYFMSWVILYSVVYSLFSVSSGAINVFLVELGVLKEGLNILGDKKYSWALIVLVNIWNSLGYNSVIFLASISNVPPELYEAASIDGADRYQKAIYITIPYMIPTLVVLFIMNSGWILNSGLDQYFVFTNPTNRPTMEVFDMYIYRYGIKLMNYSYATAVGIIKTVVSILLLFTINTVSKKLTSRSIL
ncbi:MAG: ABC transporter permease [Clostridia bacterium]|nr:ABC transporter permease subunit [Spirochaetia bacterium]